MDFRLVYLFLITLCFINQVQPFVRSEKRDIDEDAKKKNSSKIEKQASPTIERTSAFSFFAAALRMFNNGGGYEDNESNSYWDEFGNQQYETYESNGVYQRQPRYYIFEDK